MLSQKYNFGFTHLKNISNLSKAVVWRQSTGFTIGRSWVQSLSNTRWKWCQSHARIDFCTRFWFIIENKKNRGSQMRHIKNFFFFLNLELVFRALRENARYIPKSSFLMRRHYFNNEESGVLKTQLVSQTNSRCHTRFFSSITSIGWLKLMELSTTKTMKTQKG